MILISGAVVLLASFVSAVVLVGGLGRLTLQALRLKYEGEESLIATASFGVAALSVVSIIIYLAGLFNPATFKVLFLLTLLLQLKWWKTPEVRRLSRQTTVIALLLIPAIAYVIISPVVEKDLENIATIQHLISSGRYADSLPLGDFFYSFGSCALASVFDWIPAYNFLSGYGWITAAAALWGVYLLSNRFFGGNAGIASVLLVTCFQLYSRSIDYRSTLIGIVFFLYFAYLATKELSRERMILCLTLFINASLISPLGFGLCLLYASFMLLKRGRMILAGLAVAAMLLMRQELITLLLDYGLLLLVGIAGLAAVKDKEHSGILSLCGTCFLILILVAVIKPYEGAFLYDKPLFDLLKDDTLYLIPISLCLAGGSALGRMFGKKAIYAALILVLIPHQAWFYQSAAGLHLPTREEVHSFQPYPGGVSGSPFILPVQAAYMAFRYYDAKSAGLFPVSIYGGERTEILGYLFSQRRAGGFFFDLTPEDRSQEFDAVAKYTGMLEAALEAKDAESLANGTLEDKTRVIEENNIRWIIASEGQAKEISGLRLKDGGSIEEVFQTKNYAILKVG